jgi:hypothetical protein
VRWPRAAAAAAAPAAAEPPAGGGARRTCVVTAAPVAPCTMAAPAPAMPLFISSLSSVMTQVLAEQLVLTTLARRVALSTDMPARGAVQGQGQPPAGEQLPQSQARTARRRGPPAALAGRPPPRQRQQRTAQRPQPRSACSSPAALQQPCSPAAALQPCSSPAALQQPCSPAAALQPCSSPAALQQPCRRARRSPCSCTATSVIAASARRRLR